MWLTNWNDHRDRRVAVENCDLLSAPNGTKILAQPGLELSDLDTASHDQMIVISGHKDKLPGCRAVALDDYGSLSGPQ